MSEMTVEDLVARYVQLRDFIKQKNDEFDEQMSRPKEAMRRLEGMLLERLNEQGAENVRTKAGTVYRTVRSNVSVADREAFLKQVRALDWWDAMDVRPTKTTIDQYEQEKGEPFPGITVSKVFTVGVRRS